MGGTSGSPLGREEGSRGTFMEWFPWRVFAFFRRAAKEGRSRRSEISFVLFPSFVPAAAGIVPGFLRIRRLCLLFAALSRRLRRVTFFARTKKVTKEMRSRGPASEYTSFTPFPQMRNTAKTAYHSVTPPSHTEADASV